MLFHFTFDFFPSSHLLASFCFPYTDISLHFLPWCFLLYGWGCFVGFFFFFAFLFCHSGQFQWCHNAFCCLLLQLSCFFDFHTSCFPLQILACCNSRGTENSAVRLSLKGKVPGYLDYEKKKSLQKHKDSQIQIINFPLLVTSVEFHIYK